MIFKLSLTGYGRFHTQGNASKISSSTLHGTTLNALSWSKDKGLRAKLLPVSTPLKVKAPKRVQQEQNRVNLELVEIYSVNKHSYCLVMHYKVIVPEKKACNKWNFLVTNAGLCHKNIYLPDVVRLFKPFRPPLIPIKVN